MTNEQATEMRDALSNARGQMDLALEAFTVEEAGNGKQRVTCDNLPLVLTATAAAMQKLAVAIARLATARNEPA